MPEPVVLLRPALPAPSDPDTVPEAEPSSDGPGSTSVSDDSTGGRKRRKSNRSTPGALARTTSLGLHAVGRYPRASLAAGLSASILAAALVVRPGRHGADARKGENAPPVAAISAQTSGHPTSVVESVPRPATVTTAAKGVTPLAGPSTESPSLPEAPSLTDGDPGRVDGSLLALSSSKRDKGATPPKKTEAESQSASDGDPASAPPSAPPQTPINAPASEPDPIPPPDLHSGPSLLDAPPAEAMPSLPPSEEKAGNPSIVGLSPRGTTNPSTAPEPNPMDAPTTASTPAAAPLPSSSLQAPEPFKLTEAVVESAPPEPKKVEPVGGDPKSTPPPGTGAPPPAAKPNPSPSSISSSNPVALTLPEPPSKPLPPPTGPALPDAKAADPKPGSPSLAASPSPASPAPASNPLATPPASANVPEPKPAVPKSDRSPISAPDPVLLPIAAPPSTPAAPPAVQGASGPKGSDPKPTSAPAIVAGANPAPKSDPTPPALPKPDEAKSGLELSAPPATPTPPALPKPDEAKSGLELSAPPATPAAGLDLQPVADVSASKPPVVASENIVKAPEPAPAPVAAPIPVPAPVIPKSPPRTAPDKADHKDWVALPSIGKLNLGQDEDADPVAGEVPGTGTGSADGLGRPRRNRSAEMVTFEDESPQKQAADGRPAAPVSGQARNTAPSRVEPNEHVVERLENFWVISRYYYSSGRYYRALWKANADKYPDINKLHVNDVILIPAIEDLDPAYIDPPAVSKARAVRGTRKDESTDLAESATPSLRSLGNGAELDLPPASEGSSSLKRTGRRTSQRKVVDNDNDSPDTDETEVRVAARPRRKTDAESAPARRNVYKVRRNDTLRSIARDVLGDYHRADEILELNRAVIKDPDQLIVGQVLEMPGQ